VKKKYILIILGGLILGLFGWQIYQKGIKNSGGAGYQRMAMPVAVEIAPINKDTIRDVGNFTGTLNPKSQYNIAPKVSGRLEQLMVDIGDRVKRGQLIALLDSEEYGQQVVQAEADLQVAQANLLETKSSLDTAKREYDRVLELHSRGISSDSELDSAKGMFVTQDSKHKVAQAQVAHKQAALKAAQVRLSYTKIRVSWDDGSSYRVVGERFVHEGAMLTPNAPILSILEINPLIAVIHITDKDYFRVKAGQAASITTDALPGEKVTGTIARIAPLLKETSREARLEIEIPNEEELLKPGMFINAQIEFLSRSDTTIVPVGSLVRRDNQQGIFLADIENAKAQFVPVIVGITSSEMAEILEPPSLSGFVVTLGQHLLVHGSPLILPQRVLEKQGDKPPATVEAGKPISQKPGDEK
jgi:RND family efflux transporter MFP subunit